jgi:hypothetical protein
MEETEKLYAEVGKLQMELDRFAVQARQIDEMQKKITAKKLGIYAKISEPEKDG